MRTWSALAAMLFVAGAATAQINPPTPLADPGVLRISGNAQLEPVVRRWVTEFEARNPRVRVEISLKGSDVAMAALYTDKADIALLGREAAEMEAKAFEWVYRYPPTQIEILAGSVGSSGRSPALAIFVHRSNPIASISLRQLAATFGAGGASTWGDLGLGGAWRDRPIRLYAPSAESGTGRFFREEAMGGSNKMAWDKLTEFKEPVLPIGHVDRFGASIARALAADPEGMGIASLDVVRPELKAIPVSGGQQAVHPTKASVSSGDYPLARTVYAYANRRPGTPADADVAAFLRFALSPEGQAIAAQASDYVPLDPKRAVTARRLVD